MFESAVPACGTIADSATLDPRCLLIALNQASYEWCLETDRLTWSVGAAKVLGIRDGNALASGKAFAGLIDFDMPGGRYEAMVHRTSSRTSEGAAYCLRYAYRAGDHGRKRWIEDRGRWFAGPDGRPASARGLVRVVAECTEDEAGVTQPSAGQVLGHALAKVYESGRQAGLFLVSINRLGLIHGEFGAVVADAVAAQVMRGLRSVLRVGDNLASIADGKFALVLSGCETGDLAQAAERFHRAIARVIVEAETATINPSISIGGVRIDASSADAGSALHAAQSALDRCEREQPGGFVAFAEADEKTAAASALQSLARALNEDRVFLAFEPVMQARGVVRDLFRARAFIRTPNAPTAWHPARITPGCDPALARRFALRLIDMAGAVLARYPGVELALPLPVAVVPSAGRGEAFARLTLELDEVLAKADLDQGGRGIAAMRACGARVGIAGFGGGHISFEDLRKLEVTRVTLHGALVDTADQVAQGRFALRSLIAAAVQRGIGIGAEWVDEDAIATLLHGWGCDRLQGSIAGPMRLDLPRPRGAGRHKPMAMTGT